MGQQISGHDGRTPSPGAIPPSKAVHHYLDLVLGKRRPLEPGEVGALLASLNVSTEHRPLPRGIRGALEFDGQSRPVVVLDIGLKAELHDFVAAHELGHLLLSQKTSTAALALNLKSWSGPQAERVCDRISGELVMPAEWLQGTIPKIRDLQSLHLYAAQCNTTPSILIWRTIGFSPRLAYVTYVRNGRGSWSPSRAIGHAGVLASVQVNLASLDLLPEGGSRVPSTRIVRSEAQASFMRHADLVEALFVAEAGVGSHS